MELLRQGVDIAGSLLPYSLRFWDWDGKEPWTADDIPDLTGKVAIVTGGNGGVGLETCYELVRHGAHVFLGARSQEKFDGARRSVETRLASEQGGSRKARGSPHGKLTFLEADMSTIASARRAGQTFLEHKTERLDILVLCAGLASGPATPNEDGIEPLMATNCINQVAFFRELQSLITATGITNSKGKAKETSMSRRIVFVSSAAHRWSDMAIGTRRPTYVSWDNVNDARRSEQARYSQSKLAQILVNKWLQYDLMRGRDTATVEDDIACLSLHPGEINNAFVSKNFTATAQKWSGVIPGIEAVFHGVIKAVLLDEREGARTCLFAATAREVDERGWRGVYLTYPCQLCTPSRIALSMDTAERWWTLINDRIDERIAAESL